MFYVEVDVTYVLFTEDGKHEHTFNSNGLV